MVFIVVVALALRLGYISLLGDQLTFDEPIYDDLVTNLLTGRGYCASCSSYYTSVPYQATSLQAPIYPLFLAAVYSVTGLGAFTIARVVQAVLTTGSVVLLMWVAWKTWGKWAAIVTGGIAAIYPPFLYFTGLLMTENLSIFVLLVFVLLWLTAVRRGKTWLYLVTGVVYGIACLTREMTFYFLPMLLLATVLVQKKNIRPILARVCLLLIGTAVVMSPWIGRNYAVHHAFVPTTTKGGYALYIYTYPAPSLDFNDRFDQIPIPDLHGLTEIEREAAFRSLAISNIAAFPLLQIKFAAAKVLDFWNPASERGPWPIRVAFTLMFIVTAFLAVVGLSRTLVTREQRALGLLLLLLILYHTLCAALFTGGGKARLTVEPLLILSAGSGAVWIVERGMARLGAAQHGPLHPLDR
jgi:4-amino-4-deoxy-L-arabinose transferase-like glycosyltransferase